MSASWDATNRRGADTHVGGRPDPCGMGFDWAPPEHPDPPSNTPVTVDPADDAVDVPYVPVWATVEFSTTGVQRVPAFVEKTAQDRVYTQFVHMGFPYKGWLMRDKITHRTLRERK